MSRSRESSLGSVAMEEEEDDLYGTGPPETHAQNNTAADESDEDEDDDEDDESDIEIVTERPDLGPEPTTASRTAQKPSADPSQPTTTTPSHTQQLATRAAPSTIRITSSSDHPIAQPKPILLPGAQYPAIRMSKNELDLDNIPLWEGKPITELDIDADLAEAMKPWRRPGADQSEYFNYGFDEFSWALYCEKQKSMRNGIQERKDEMMSMQAMIGEVPGMPSMPGSGGGGDAMPGMPSQDEMMGMMSAYMQANNIQDPGQVDFGAVMQFMGAGGGGMGMGGGGGGSGNQGGWDGGQQQQGGYGMGGGGGRGGRRGRGRW